MAKYEQTNSNEKKNQMDYIARNFFNENVILPNIKIENDVFGKVNK